MKCFNHPAIDAVALCKNCSKGLCHECLVELENGIACKASCVEEVTAINQLIDRNKTTHIKTASAYYRNAFIYGAMGLVFILVAFLDDKVRMFMLPIGSIFLIAAVWS